jgi:hypothetical protein
MFGNKHIPETAKHLSLTIDGYVLEQTDCTKFLGVYIDAKLSWKKHIDYIALKISKGLGAMSRAKNILPQKILLMLYHSMIYPYLTYCNIVWGSASTAVLSRLIYLQKRAVRLITKSHFRAKTNPLFCRLSLLKVANLVDFQTAQFMYKVKSKQLPISCCNVVAVAAVDRVYSTRNVSYFIIIGSRTNIREKSVNVHGPKLWKSLPVEIQNAPSFCICKRSLIKYFMNSYIQVK